MLAGSQDSLHFLERLTIAFQIEKSIVPTALNLAQFKVSGVLPSLQLNFSDTKYKSLMRLIDVCIPNFGEPDASAVPLRSSGGGGFQLPPGLFGQAEAEYNVDDEDADSDGKTEGDANREELFFEADDGTTGVSLQSILAQWVLTIGCFTVS